MTSPTGSGSAAIARTPSAIARTRPSSSASRSSSASSSPAARPACMSSSLASRISPLRSTSACAIDSRARSFTAVLNVASARDASRAVRQRSATDWAVVAMPQLHQHEVVAVNGLLARARQHLADLDALEAHDPPQLRGRVVADALADHEVGLRDVDGVAGVEAAADVDDPHRQQRRAAL